MATRHYFNADETGAAHKPVQPQVMPDVPQLQSEYRAVLDFAVRFNRRRSRLAGMKPNLNTEALIRGEMTRLVQAGQAGKLAPAKLKRMVIASAQKNRSHRQWTPDATLERRHGMLAGAQRHVKI
ncbi:hypothetical protein J2125_004968 [Erwinia toletana]|uniref:Uncharacterized protein n=1 Tax=Winslowiella toletana TaxID=92490 RepID=A0ABS4PG95_9GAMM|nr:hypothetical protein [Winslowiella toletana]MBP2171672.1 hypothetical protein [Winslowiella toletana]